MKSYILSLIILCAFSLASCSVNKAKIDNDLKKYFDDVQAEGCFTMLNNADGEVTVYNMKYDTLRLQPGATFGIVNALIALQTGILSDENASIAPDSTVMDRDSLCNRSMNIKTALTNNCRFFDQALARKIGKDIYKKWIDSVAYGNRKIGGAVDSFWFNNQLTISPDEQLGLMKKLYFGQLPFRKSVQESVADMLLKEDNSAYKLYYITGNGADEKQKPLSWTIGWIVENRHVYFFSTLVKNTNANKDLSTASFNITRNILKHYGFFEGKK